MKSAVILTVYKRYNYISQALNSILSQSELPDQVIIVADNVNMLKRNVFPIKEIPNFTVIEANYPQYGKKISAALDNLDDVDIVFFLEDDDMFKNNKIEYIRSIFEKNDDIVMVHNHQEYIDEYGNKIENFFTQMLDQSQPHERLIINPRNISILYRYYPKILFNNSSISIRKYILDKYKSFISNIDLAIDSALLFVSLLEGNVLHIPDKLTYYRVGSGSSSYGKFSNYNEFLENEYKIACLQNRQLEDFRKMLQLVNNCDSCKVPVEVEILNKETYLYLLRRYFNCAYEAQIPSYFSLAAKCIRYLIKKEISPYEFIFHLALISLPLVLGKRRGAEFYLKRKFKRLSKKE